MHDTKTPGIYQGKDGLVDALSLWTRSEEVEELKSLYFLRFFFPLKSI